MNVPDNNETEKAATWPESLDALVAAAKHHSLIFQGDRVRVLQTLIPPGETTAVHTHRWPSVVHVVSASEFIRRDGEGNVLSDTRKAQSGPPEFFWSEPMGPHSVENVGDTEILLILVELKDAGLHDVELKDVELKDGWSKD